MTPPLLEVRDLEVSFRRGRESFAAVSGVSFTIDRGERVALVGESGSGKSVTALALTRLITRMGGTIGESSQVLLDGEDLMRWREPRLRTIRGGRIAMIFQDPLSSLNPVFSVGDQIRESIHLHHPDMSTTQTRERAVELLDRVGIPKANLRVDAYPHEFSGGMRQRAMIASALACSPDLLVADEPTTALDVTIQGQILQLLDDLVESAGLAVLLITHDLGVVAGFTERLMVMYAGRIIESGPAEELFYSPQHPYTAGLIGSVPRLDRPRNERLVSIAGAPPNPVALPSGCPFHPRCEYSDSASCITDRPALVGRAGAPGEAACHYAGTLELASVADELPQAPLLIRTPGPAQSSEEPLLQVRDLVKVYGGGGGLLGLRKKEAVRAVDGVSFDIHRGEVFGVVGESGSGKSTVARCVTRLVEPTSGEVIFDGEDLLGMRPRALRRARREVQMVFQDPTSALDPRLRVRALLAEPMRIHRLWGQEGFDEDRLRELMDLVGLERDSLNRFPHEFSGGQRQRVAIARALALRPKLVICDEPVSALDVSIRAGVINLLADLRAELGLSYLFIAHDLSLVRHICDRVAAMYKGVIVEVGEGDDFYTNPQHPYTQALLACEPVPDPRLERERRRAMRNKVLWTDQQDDGEQMAV